MLPALRCHLRFLAIKPFLLGVKTSGFKRKLCFIESTIVPSYNSIMGAIFEYDKNKASIFIVFRVLKVLKLKSAQLLRVKKPNLFHDLKKGVFLPEQSNTS